MYVIREIMYCKPGKVRPLLEKFKALDKLGKKLGMPKIRLMTDFAADAYWQLVAELEVSDLKEFEQMNSNPQGSPEDLKKYEKLMEGYHDLVDHGKREIFKLEE